MTNFTQANTINHIMTKDYFLGTFAAPAKKTSVECKNLNDFEELVINRIDVKDPALAGAVMITPMQGMYKGQAEDSYMISFNAPLTMAKSLLLLEIMTELFKDLGQESFIFRQGLNQSHNLFDAFTGKVLMVGSDITLTDNVEAYSVINKIPFTMQLENFEV